MGSFLTAEWRRLAIANYSIEPHILSRYIPYGTELDLWEGKCYVSLIGFLFKNTHLKGIRIPFHAHFEEVNLRFYVRRKEGDIWKRGVVFIKEIVPKYALAFIANLFYKENYRCLPMKHVWIEDQKELKVAYHWKNKGSWQSLELCSDQPLLTIEPGSEVEFITEHYWGYALFNKAKTYEYEVRHPRWAHYKVTDYKIKVDFELNYGADFAFLNERRPDSVMLAEGSIISVENKKVLKNKSRN